MDSNRLKQLLHYDASTGLFTWTRYAIKKQAGYNHRGYTYIQVDGKPYSAHRLAWLYVYGVWPTGMLDHINQDRGDNRIINLREASNQLNQYNVSKYTNNTGVKGVCKYGNRYKSRVTVHGKTHHLGVFDTAEEAEQAYLTAKTKVCHQMISMTNIKIVEHT
jgi:hypothetical protein